jgi:nucleotide-binding universal stress UspA family protein
MLTRVLAPTDGSEVACRAVRMAAELLQQIGSGSITILAVVSPIDPKTTDLDADEIVRQDAGQRVRALATLGEARRIVEAHQVLCNSRLRDGAPASAVIAQECAEGGYDLIVMGSRGLGMRRENPHRIGSVTEHLLQRLAIPVLVVPGDRDYLEP